MVQILCLGDARSSSRSPAGAGERDRNLERQVRLNVDAALVQAGRATVLDGYTNTREVQGAVIDAVVRFERRRRSRVAQGIADRGAGHGAVQVGRVQRQIHADVANGNFSGGGSDGIAVAHGIGAVVGCAGFSGVVAIGNTVVSVGRGVSVVAVGGVDAVVSGGVCVRVVAVCHAVVGVGGRISVGDSLGVVAVIGTVISVSCGVGVSVVAISRVNTAV